MKAIDGDDIDRAISILTDAGYVVLRPYEWEDLLEAIDSGDVKEIERVFGIDM